MWEIEYTDEFNEWWQQLSETQQDAVRDGIDMLRRMGPRLGRPYVDTLQSAKHNNLKELRSQCQGKPLRTFFAFDPRRTAVLLIGGDKTGDKRFYDKMIPLADSLYDEYLAELKKEGLI